jgi:hypothetical protein
MSGWIAHSLCPKSGQTRQSAARAQGCLLSGPVRPSRNWPGRGGSAPSTRASRRPGWPVRVCTGLIARCGTAWQRAPTRMSWPSRGKNRSGGPVASGRSQRSWRCWRRRTGGDCGRVTGPQAPDGMTGGGSPWRHRYRPTGVGGSWSVGVAATRPSAPRPSCVPRRRPPWRLRSRWSVAAGPSHRALRRPKGRSGWSRMRAGGGQAGLVLAPWPCGRMPS